MWAELRVRNPEFVPVLPDLNPAEAHAICRALSRQFVEGWMSAATPVLDFVGFDLGAVAIWGFRTDYLVERARRWPGPEMAAMMDLVRRFCDAKWPNDFAEIRRVLLAARTDLAATAHERMSARAELAALCAPSNGT
ncbi:MAG: hypothetical protein ACREH6_07160 [Geminicoccaceae bacterium]